MSAESLLKPGMKFIPLTRTDRTRLAENAREDSGRVSEASNYQVFIEGSLHNTSVRNSKNRVRGLDIVGYAQPRLYLVVVAADAAINISAQAQVERPVARGDRVLNI